LLLIHVIARGCVNALLTEIDNIACLQCVVARMNSEAEVKCVRVPPATIPTNHQSDVTMRTCL